MKNLNKILTSTFSDNILPTASGTIDLGTTDLPFNDIATTGKVYLGDASPIFSGTGFVNGDAWVKGRIQAGAGAVLKATEWGTSLFTTPYTGLGTTRAGTCTFDLTGGAYEKLFTVVPTGGWVFTSGDVGKIIILITGTHIGAVAIIEEYVDATNVILETCGWDDDVAAGTRFIQPIDLMSFTSPELKVNNIGTTCEWENNAYDHTAPYCTKLEASAAASGVTNLRIKTGADGWGNVDSMQIYHNTGVLPSGSLQKVVRVVLDDSLCTSSPGPEIQCFKFSRTKGNSVAEVDAISVGTEFTHALHVDGSTAANPGYGYTFSAAFAVTDRVNSGGGGNDSFINAAVNTQLFTADNTGILIGSDNTFTVIEYVMQVAGSATITPTWQYSTGNGTWATLSVSDTTLGFRQSGKISFTPPIAWAKSNKCNGSTGDITSAYYVRITRTANSLATPPTEKYFELFSGGSVTDMLIRGDGTIQPAQMIDASAENVSIYYSLTQNKLVFKDLAGVVRDLY